MAWTHSIIASFPDTRASSMPRRRSGCGLPKGTPTRPFAGMPAAHEPTLEGSVLPFGG